MAAGDPRHLVAAIPRIDGDEPGGAMEHNDHPKGALVCILIYLLLLVLLWINVYLQLWLKE
jgi:hypothetical protein